MSEIELFVAVVKANPMMYIHCPDINDMIREVRYATGERLQSSNEPDYYDHPFHTDWEGFPREMTRRNPRKFSVWISNKKV